MNSWCHTAKPLLNRAALGVGNREALCEANPPLVLRGELEGFVPLPFTTEITNHARRSPCVGIRGWLYHVAPLSVGPELHSGPGTDNCSTRFCLYARLLHIADRAVGR
jgi:hypothetical protein